MSDKTIFLFTVIIGVSMVALGINMMDVGTYLAGLIILYIAWVIGTLGNI